MVELSAGMKISRIFFWIHMAPQNVEAGALVESQGGGHEGGGAKKKIRSTLITQKKAKFIGLCLVDRNSPLSLCRSQGSWVNFVWGFSSSDLVEVSEIIDGIVQ